MHQITIPIEGLPLNMILLSDGTLALSPNQQFKGIIDGKAVFTMDGFSVDGVSYEYNRALAYKNEPELLGYLQGLNLPMPVINQGMPFGFHF